MAGDYGGERGGVDGRTSRLTRRAEARLRAFAHRTGLAMTQGPLILLVEDEPLILQATAELLESEGFCVIQASSALDAIGRLDGGAETAVALMVDLDLQADLTGFDVAREARRRNSQIAVLYTSGSEGEGLNKQGVPNARFVAKPYRYAEVANLLRELIAHPAGDDPSPREANP